MRYFHDGDEDAEPRLLDLLNMTIKIPRYHPRNTPNLWAGL